MDPEETTPSAPTSTDDAVGAALLSAFGGRATQAAKPSEAAKPAAATPTPPEEPAPVAEAERPAADDSDDDDEQLPVEQRFERARRREARVRAEAEEARQERERARRQAASFKGHMSTAQQKLQALERERDEFRKLATDADARENRRWEDAIKAAPDEDTRRAWEREYALDKRERQLAREEQERKLAAERDRQVADYQRGQHLAEAEHELRASVVPSLRAIVEGHAATHQLPAGELADLLAFVASPEVAQLAAVLPLDPDPQKDRLSAYLQQTAERVVAEIDRRAAAYEERVAEKNRREAARTYRPELTSGGGGGQQRAPEKLDEITDAHWLRMLKGQPASP